MKELFLDIGELGWSLYLSAHMKWLKANRQPVPGVMTLPGRECFYEEITSEIYMVPDSFYKDFDGNLQNCFGIYGVSIENLKAYFNLKLSWKYRISTYQPLNCGNWRRVFEGQMLFKSYPNKIKFVEGKEILVFPRHRKKLPFASRNLPRVFYIDLLIRLCDENKDCVIKTIGTISGAYNITKNEVARDNYENWVGKTANLQAAIDRFQIAICTIGGTSSLPKLALLQGVPSFIIGHEPKRFKTDENWLDTKVGFYEVPTIEYTILYTMVHSKDCINKIIDFVEECS